MTKRRRIYDEDYTDPELKYTLNDVVYREEGAVKGRFNPTYGKYGKYVWYWIEGEPWHFEIWNEFHWICADQLKIPLVIIEIIARYIYSKEHMDKAYW